MKPSARTILIGLAAYLVFMVVGAPAARVLPLLQPRLQGVHFSGVEGSLWSGRAAAVRVDKIPLQDVSWSLHPFALFLGKLEATLVASLNGEPIRTDAGTRIFGGAYLADLDGRIAADELLHRLQLRQLKAQGMFEFQLQEVIWTDERMPLVNGTVSWQPAQVVAPVELVLGTVTLETRAEEGVTRGQLKAGGGSLLVQGDVELKGDGAYRIDAQVQQKGSVHQAVSNFLSTFAEYRDGSYRLEYSDTL